MKKILFFALAALLAGLSTGACSNPDDAPETADAPTDLVVTGAIHNRATVTWKYDGTADFFGITVGDRDEVLVSEPAYEATGLEPDTEYGWSVRARRNGLWSASVHSEDTIRTMPDGVEFTYLHNTDFWDQYFAQGTSAFYLRFTSYNEHPATQQEFENTNGWQLAMDILCPPVDVSATKQFLDIPTGVYTFTPSPGPYTVVLSETTALVEIRAGQPVLPVQPVTGGSMALMNHGGNRYTIALAVKHGGVTRHFYYVGEIAVENPQYVKPSGRVVELGTFSGVAQFTHKADAFGNGSVDGYLMLAYQTADDTGTGSGVYLDTERGKLMGHGWTAALQFHAPLDSGPMLPAHEYTVDRSGQPWTVMAGNTQNGMYLRRIEVGVTVDTRWLSIGTVTARHDEQGICILDVDAIDFGTGDNYKFTVRMDHSKVPEGDVTGPGGGH